MGWHHRRLPRPEWVRLVLPCRALPDRPLCGCWLRPWRQPLLVLAALLPRSACRSNALAGVRLKLRCVLRHESAAT